MTDPLAAPFRLHHRRTGAGDPLLLVQGMSGHHRMWGERFVGSLEAAYDVVAYDHRGIGASDRGDGAFTIADLADDAAELIDHLGWESAHVLGISMGGMVAQELALRHPSRARTLVLGCTTAGGPDAFDAPGPARMVAAMQTRDPEVATRAGFEANLSARFRERPGAFEEFQAAVLAERVPVEVVMTQSLAALGHDVSARLSELDVPTLVVHGSEDEMILAREGERLAGLVPGARLDLWEGVGHLFWWEDPDRAVDAVRSHCR